MSVQEIVSVHSKLSVYGQMSPARAISYPGWEGTTDRVPVRPRSRHARGHSATLTKSADATKLRRELLPVLVESYRLLKLSLRGFTLVSIPFWVTTMGLLSLL